MTGSRYLITSHEFLDQTGHSDLEVPEGQSPAFFVLVYGSESIRLLVCPASHTYVRYAIAEKKLAKLLHLRKLAVPAYSVFVGRGYLQHGVCGRRDSHYLRYHTYVIT